MKRCPFGAEIAAIIGSGKTPDVRLYAGPPAHRWSRALARRALVGAATATLLPPGDDPRSIRWPGCPIVADVTGLAGDQIHALAEALVRDGAPLAYLIDLTDASRSLRVVEEGA
ncbi:hypothetical protein [Metallibacterium scheffleri]|uniref:hypothetical protein n=1 Tax=Metallibacterium scheffleri TaxID=993689 RepID=UPI0009C18D98|nr:hypothetical protein [Metallibacterium scheffleri]